MPKNLRTGVFPVPQAIVKPYHGGVNPGRMFYQPPSRAVKPATTLVEWAHPNTNATVGAGFAPILPALFRRQRPFDDTRVIGDTQGLSRGFPAGDGLSRTSPGTLMAHRAELGDAELNRLIGL